MMLKTAVPYRQTLAAICLCLLSGCHFKVSKTVHHTPDEAAIALIEATNEVKFAKQGLVDFRVHLQKTNAPAELIGRLSDEQIAQATASDELWLRRYYVRNFTTDEIEALTELFNSKAWKKFAELSKNSAKEQMTKPTIQLTQKISEDLFTAMRAKSGK